MTRQWETNWQRSESGRWQSRTWNTQEEAEQAAQDWQSWQAFNVNWQRPGTESQPVWVVRNGRRCG